MTDLPATHRVPAGEVKAGDLIYWHGSHGEHALVESVAHDGDTKAILNCVELSHYGVWRFPLVWGDQTPVNVYDVWDGVTR